MGIYRLKMVIFHSHVELPDGILSLFTPFSLRFHSRSESMIDVKLASLSHDILHVVYPIGGVPASWSQILKWKWAFASWLHIVAAYPIP